MLKIEEDVLTSTLDFCNYLCNIRSNCLWFTFTDNVICRLYKEGCTLVDHSTTNSYRPYSYKLGITET